ncbi:MAG: hypothetical protein ACP5HU_09380 [Phycisphaerae bacterium]
MTDKSFIQKLAGKLSRRRTEPEEAEPQDRPAEPPTEPAKRPQPSPQPTTEVPQQQETAEQPQEDYQPEPSRKPGVFKSSGKVLAEAVETQQREVSELVEQVRELVTRTDRMLEASGTQSDVPRQLREAVQQIGEQNRQLSESLEGIAEENRRQNETLQSVRTALQQRDNEELTEQVQALSGTLEEMKSSGADTAGMLKQVRDQLLGAYDELSNRLNRHAKRLHRMMIAMFVALGVLVVALITTIVIVS